MPVSSLVAPAAPGRAAGPLLLLTLLFLLLGTVLNFSYLLPPYLAMEYSLRPDELVPGQRAFWGASLLLALPAGWLVAQVGSARGLAGGLVALAAGVLALGAALGGAGLWLATAGLALLGAGSTLLQVAAFAYLAGPGRHAAMRLMLVGAAQALGSALLLPLSNLLLAGRLAAQPPGGPGLALAGILLAGAALVLASGWFAEPASLAAGPVGAEAGANATLASALAHRPLRLGLLAGLVCVGVPAGLGALLIFFGQSLPLTHLSAFTVARLHELDAVVNYGLRALGQPASSYTTTDGGFTVTVGAALVGLYGLAGVAGRLAGLLLLQLVPGRLMLVAGAVAGAALVAAALACVLLGTTGDAPLWLLVASGLAHGLLWPLVVARALAGLGRSAAPGAGLLVLAATAGPLVAVPLLGWLATHGGWGVAFAALVGAYLYLLYYALRGGQPRPPSAAAGQAVDKLVGAKKPG